MVRDGWEWLGMVNSGWWELHFIDFLCDQLEDLEAEGMFDIFVTNLKL